MYNAATTAWLRNRAASHNGISQTLPIPTRESSREFFADTIRWIGALPSWAVLFMIILSASAVCATVILRARLEFQTSSEQFYRMTSEIQSLRHTNGSLQSEVSRLTTDAGTIEVAARERLGMVRPNDVVVPIESMSRSESMASFVH